MANSVQMNPNNVRYVFSNGGIESQVNPQSSLLAELAMAEETFPDMKSADLKQMFIMIHSNDPI